MQAIINKEELVESLAKRILLQAYKKKPIQYAELQQYVDKCQTRFYKTKLLDINFNEVNSLIHKELVCHTDELVSNYKSQYRPLINWLSNNFHALNLDSNQLINWYTDPAHRAFTKNVVEHISTDVSFVVNDDYVSNTFIKNIINNEESIRLRMLHNKEFWFTDTGYTNFVAAKGKPWHRLCHNHIHQSLTHLNFPADRLKMLESMPQPWRTNGNKILVVESSDYHYEMFGTDRNTWRDRVSNELANHTDRSVEYRVKDMNRKMRKSVYELLMSSNDYYCVISDSSAAAIEAVWAGVPIITLNRHVTIPVARTQISDINNLYRGPIGDWLCALTYSQFTKQEMQNGTAWRILEQYHV